MGAYAWYYTDFDSDTCYWSYSYEYSNSEFARVVSGYIGRTITASDTSYADREKDLDKRLSGRNAVHV